MDSDKNISSKTHKSDLFLSLGILIILITVLIIAVPTKTIFFNVEVAYTDTETYYEKEPYEVQEAYQEQDPYQDIEYFIDTVPVQVSVPYEDIEYYYQSYDAGTGMYYSYNPTGCYCTGTRYMYDVDGVYGALCVQLNCRLSRTVTKYRTETEYQSIRKQRPVTKYKTVTKYRNVTQYRDVPKTRQVMKTRMEPQPVEVNWLFGFKTPYELHLPFISGD
jgi:hypothetical protein